MKISKTGKMVFVVATLVGLSACSSSGSGGGGVASVFDGTWVSECTVTESGNYSIRELRIAGSTIERNDTVSTNADCSAPFTRNTAVISIAVGAGIEVPGRALAYPVDLTLNQLLARPLNAQVTAQLNAQSECGITNWAANVDFDVSDCLAATGGRTLPLGSFNMYMVEENQLFSGNGSGEEANRPTSVSLIPDYTRR